jgi:SAM-dependent methyltransferase
LLSAEWFQRKMQMGVSTATGYPLTGQALKERGPSACPVCCYNGPFPDRPSPEGFHLLECKKCGIVRLFPQPDEGELASLYDKTYYGEDRKKFLSPIESGVAALNFLKWKKLKSLLSKGGRLLDIGCGRGTLLKLARESGFEAYGTERPSPVGHEVPGVLYKSLQDCNFPDNYFQLVVLWHVLEHLPNPAATLQEIFRVLKPGGWLSVAVPNYGGAQATAAGPHWFHLDLPRHFWHFRRSSLEALLMSNGFRVTSCATSSIEYDWFGILQSWMNRAFEDDNRLYSLLKGSEAMSAAGMRRVAAAAFLALPALAGVLWHAAAREGGTLTLTAQKVASANASIGFSRSLQRQQYPAARLPRPTPHVRANG